jgi:lauroyl/myristoyl acyltransferase
MDEQTSGRPKPFFNAMDIVLWSMFHLIRFASRVVPPSLLYSLLEGLGCLAFYAMPGMHSRLVTKISEALPEVTDSREIVRIGRKACGAFLFPILDFFVMGKYGERYIRELRIEGMENLEKADAAGKGTIITGTHHGWIAIVHAVMLRLGKVYTPIMFYPSDTPTPHYVWNLALQGFFLGADPKAPVFWAGKDTVRNAIEHLGQGKRIGLTFDVDGQGIVEFFGRPTALASGIAYFSYKTGAPIVPIALIRGKGVFDNRLVISPPIFPDQEAERSVEMNRILQQAVSEGEKFIRADPGQWMNWFGLWHWWDEAEKLMADKGTEMPHK